MNYFIIKIPKIILTILVFAIVLKTTNSFGQQTAESKKGMVVSSTKEASQAGLSILKMGGNAIDAAAATAFALMVTDPAMCSLGGRSQILLFLENGEIAGIDGATQSPSKVGEPAGIGHGYATAAIPGSPAALEKMVNIYGTLPLRTILQPALKLAKDGFVINKEYHDIFRKYGKFFRSYPGSAKYFLKDDGSFYSNGEILKQPALAGTLEKISEYGAGILYRGELAKAIANDMKHNNGLILEEDLAQYKPLPGEIIEGNYRGYKIIGRGDQCDGASVIEMLHILEHFNLTEHIKNEPEYLHILAQALYIGSTDEMLPDQFQISRDTAAKRVMEINLNQALPVPVKEIEIFDEGETNHLCVVDSIGNAVSITQSVGPNFGSKVVNPDLGFFYAYSYDMNDNPVPLQREKTSQSPTIVLKTGKPFIVLGSAGSSRIPGSVVQTIINFIDHKMTPALAVASPRIFYFDNELRLENKQVSESTLIKLKNMGYNIKSYNQLNGWFGRVQALFIDSTSEKKIIGISDPRDYGVASGL